MIVKSTQNRREGKTPEVRQALPDPACRAFHILRGDPTSRVQARFRRFASVSILDRNNRTLRKNKTNGGLAVLPGAKCLRMCADRGPGLCLRALPGAEEASKERCSGQRRASVCEQAALGTANWIFPPLRSRAPILKNKKFVSRETSERNSGKKAAVFC